MRNLFICVLVCSSISEASSHDLSTYLIKRYSSASCDSNYIYGASVKCYEKLLTLSEIPTTSSGEELQNIETMCGKKDNSSRCFYKMMEPCGETGTYTAKMLEEIFEHVCSADSQSVLMRSGTCWTHETLREEIGICTEKMNRDFQTLSYNDYCDILETYVTCIGEKARDNEECNMQAEIFLTDLVAISVKPTMDKLHC